VVGLQWGKKMNQINAVAIAKACFHAHTFQIVWSKMLDRSE
jgi:hypothetical protein